MCRDDAAQEAGIDVGEEIPMVSTEYFLVDIVCSMNEIEVTLRFLKFLRSGSFES